MKTKRIISILLAVLMLIPAVSVSAFAEDDPAIAEVLEYLVAPSQYTNSGAYGTVIKGTVNGHNTLASLGNFGGYVIYEMNEPIYDAPEHRYGTDFIVCGNAFNGALTTQEPGQVWVSQDGERWYALAGSEHYEDETVWDYSVTYTKQDEKSCSFTDSLGDSGTVRPAAYPRADIYTTVTIPEDNLTLSGILLRKQRTPTTANGIATAFGYTDTRPNPKESEQFNPYCEDPANNSRDGYMDIAWAVDQNGDHAQLDWIRYIKVQTATFIDAAIFGEKSTEICAVRLIDDAEGDVGMTAAPQSVTVGDTVLTLEDGKYEYNVPQTGAFDVAVDADGANVYINNAYGAQRHFDAPTEKGIVRILVQSGESSPRMYEIHTGKAPAKTKVTISQTEATLAPEETLTLTASADTGEAIMWSTSDTRVAAVDEAGTVTAVGYGTAYVTATAASGVCASCKITVPEPPAPVTVTVQLRVSGGKTTLPPCELTVTSGLAASYGYTVKSEDHNGLPVEGVTVFDVLVAAHETVYGDAFTAQTKEDYLVMNESFITKAFGESAASSGFTVNGITPNDGIVSPQYNMFTGYACDTAVLADGDDLVYFFYQDTKNFSDLYTWFDAQTYSAAAGDAFTVQLNGYNVMYYGLNDWQTVQRDYALPLEGASVYAVINGEKTLLGTTGKGGTASITLPAEGSYTLIAEGAAKDGEGDKCPVITAYAAATVTAPQAPHKQTFGEKLLAFFRSIGAWFKMVWGKITGFFSGIFH